MSGRTDMMRAILAEHGIPLVNHAEESPAMTPKDALIEKMARAIALDTGWEPRQVEAMFTKPYADAHEQVAQIFWSNARAAYEAEHEETKG